MHCIASVPPHRPLAACRRCDVADTRRQRGSSGGSSRLLIVRILGLPQSIFCWTTAPVRYLIHPASPPLCHRLLLIISLLLLCSSSIRRTLHWISHPPTSVLGGNNNSSSYRSAVSQSKWRSGAGGARSGTVVSSTAARRNLRRAMPPLDTSSRPSIAVFVLHPRRRGCPRGPRGPSPPPDPTTAAITAVNDGNQQREQQRKRKKSEGEKEADPQAETVTANADTTSSSAGKVAYQDGADTALTSSAANMIVIKACLRLMRIVFGAG